MDNSRTAPIDISREDFRKLGYSLVDRIADLFATMKERPVTTGETPVELQKILGNASLPDKGQPLDELMERSADLLMQHSLFNGHPKFMGYITSSPTPVGALADMLAAAINPNVGANILSPMATEIEKQTIRWLAEFIGVAPSYGGILVSGGNMANFTAFLAARTVKGPKSIKDQGMNGTKLVVYCPSTTHTWIEKAAVLFGLGSEAVRWIKVDEQNRMINHLLEEAIAHDLELGLQPFMVIGTAGDVSTGAVDDLKGIASICKKFDLWFHVDGAYGIPAAVISTKAFLFDGIAEADSIALDPHKWLYSPLEAGCTLVKDPNHLIATYSSHPVYYNFSNNEEAPSLNYYEYGFQNSRGFRALKVWLALQQVGRSGYEQMIAKDIQLSEKMFELAAQHPELEAVSQSLSITTLRYIPEGSIPGADIESYLNQLNESLLNALQKGGEVFLSNAVVHGKYCLRGCIVNFRTSEKDIEEIIAIIVREGRKMHGKLMPKKMVSGQV